MEEPDTKARCGLCPHAMHVKGLDWQRLAIHHANLAHYSDALDAARKARSLAPQNAQITKLISLLEEVLQLVADQDSDYEFQSSGTSSSGSADEVGTEACSSTFGSVTGDSTATTSALGDGDLSLQDVSDASNGAPCCHSSDVFRQERMKMIEAAAKKLALSECPSTQLCSVIFMPQVSTKHRQARGKLRAKLCSGLAALKRKATLGVTSV
jgi:hypothetical protein